jgi:hypothetical protein
MFFSGRVSAPFLTLGLALCAHPALGASAQDWRILDPSPSELSSPASSWSSATPIDSPQPPISLGAGYTVAPFVLSVGDPMRDRALDCLTAAVYYEAASEPRAGQEAVAQVVLNRLRHPAFPKSVCGVVYDGVGTASTCQFTFACDGSTSRRPVARLWDNAREVAAAALSGHVAYQVGTATHYHASWVSPYWRSSLVAVGRIGNHLFYSMPGARGLASALTGRYNEDERAVPTLVRSSVAQQTSAARSQRPGDQSVDFTVWGLKMATISVKRGQISVKSPS